MSHGPVSSPAYQQARRDADELAMERARAAARGRLEDAMRAEQPHRCPGCGAWVHPDRTCTSPVCAVAS